jgi:hypothetical protein
VSVLVISSGLVGVLHLLIANIDDVIAHAPQYQRSLLAGIQKVAVLLRIETEPTWTTLRNDDLYEASAGLTWEFAQGWSLNPEVLFVRDQSNILVVNYSSTEIWITLRKDF